MIFYLVLLTLSEHIGFNAAWLLASLVCAAINGFYFKAVLSAIMLLTRNIDWYGVSKKALTQPDNDAKEDNERFR